MVDKRTVRGIRDRIPKGYFLGRKSNGKGAVELIKASDIARMGGGGGGGGFSFIGTAAKGDMLYFDGTDWVLLVPGTAGQVLQTNGPGADPSWETLAVNNADAVSIYEDDDGNVFIALSDADGLFIRDGSGNAIYVPATFTEPDIEPYVLAIGSLRI